jgi:hypothetical protein
MEFSCDPCSYSTNDNFNYKRHLETKTHQKKLNQLKTITVENTICVYCNRKFGSSSGLAKHDRSCVKKTGAAQQIETLIKTIDYKDDMIEHKDDMIDQKDDMIAQLKAENAHLRDVVNTAGKIVKTSVSSMAYALKHYNNAPALETIKNCEELSNNQDNERFVRVLVYEYKNKHLEEYIGNFIIKSCKKDDPSEQSIWNSDTSRFTYLIRNIITDNKIDWKIDKKGIQTNQFLIVPVVDYVEKEIRQYVGSMRLQYETVAQLKDGIEMVNHTSAILKMIELESLNKDILRYIAPYFYLNKNDDKIVNEQ